MAEMNAQVIEAPSGRYVIVGRIPVALHYKADHTTLALIADFGTAAVPSDSYETRSFETRTDAEDFIRDYEEAVA